MYNLTIGLEIHLKIKSPNKMFCQCPNEQNFDTLMPNANICPVCTGQPGALPTLSEQVLMQSLKLGKSLNCKINRESRFDRKSYFYPDLPMGYQITQLYQPTNIQGKVHFFLENFEKEASVHILDAHMECDTAKMIHESGKALIDFNRSGTPLVEIVTGPDFTSAEEVVDFLKELQRIARYNDISDADLEKGQMRVDVNISIKKPEDKKLGTRVEMKNINSFGMIKRAIENEYKRQVNMVENHESFSQQTRGWDDTKGSSYLMRSKEDALDYRYFPEPDMPPLVLSDEIMKKVQEMELIIPYQIIKTFKQEYGFQKEYINALISDKETLDYFISILSSGAKSKDIMNDAKTTAKWIVGPMSAYMKDNFVSINHLKITPQQFLDFLVIANEGKILDNQMKIVMDEMLQTGQDVSEIIKSKGFDAPAIQDNELENIAKTILEGNPAIVQQYKDGKTTVIGFFVGQMMKQTGGKANPKQAQDIFQKILG